MIVLYASPDLVPSRDGVRAEILARFLSYLLPFIPRLRFTATMGRPCATIIVAFVRLVRANFETNQICE